VLVHSCSRAKSCSSKSAGARTAANLSALLVDKSGNVLQHHKQATAGNAAACNNYRLQRMQCPFKKGLGVTAEGLNPDAVSGVC
jgi:hypothetical protein